jgi:general secretion pathway protein G
MRRQRSSAGFTLIELLVTLAILAVLATGAMTVVEITAQRGREQTLRVALRDIREAIDAYKRAVESKRIVVGAGETGYPPTLSALTDGVADATSTSGAKIYFLRRLPRDPNADASLAAAQTWGLRSYASDPANPQPGRDVFDVHSLSQRTGLNGIPYREW